MKSQIRYSFILFFAGFGIGALIGVVKGTPLPIFTWKFSLLEIGRGTLIIFANNTAAAIVTAFGPIIVSRFTRIEKDSAGLSFLYMIPTLILFVNGFSTGYHLGSALKLEGLLAFLAILPHGILEIPAIIICGAIGLKNVDEIKKGIIVGGRYFAFAMLLFLVGAWVEGGITPQLAGAAPPEIEIIQMKNVTQAILGDNVSIFVEINNAGFSTADCKIIISSENGRMSHYDLTLNRGINRGYYNITYHGTGNLRYKAVILWKGNKITEREESLTVIKPDVRIGEVELPDMYAGENGTIVIPIENRESKKIEFVLEFASSTGSLNTMIVSVGPNEWLPYWYNTSFGQPGKRKFEISLLYFDSILDKKVVNTTVNELRISPKIMLVDIPRLEVNKTSNISIVVNNTGNKGGNVSILIFEAELQQLMHSGDITNIYLSKSHLENRIWEEMDFFIDSGETKNILIAVTPESPHKGNLLIFSLRREVVADVIAKNIEVIQTLS